MKCKLAVVTEDVVAQSKKFSDEDHQREYKKLEAKIEDLKKTITNMKQVHNARNTHNKQFTRYEGALQSYFVYKTQQHIQSWRPPW